MNLILNLDKFLAEMRSQTEMVQTIVESSGKLIIKLKNTNSANSYPFIQQVDLTAQKLALSNYIRLVYSDPYQEKIAIDNGEVYRFKLADIIQTDGDFLSELQGRAEIAKILRNDKEVIALLKKGVIGNPETFRIFRRHMYEHLKPEHFEPGMFGRLQQIRKGCVLENTNYKSIEYKIDLAALHKDRLDYYYHRDMTAKDAEESIHYLSTLGWTEKQIGVSHATFHRHKTNSKPQNNITESQADTSPNYDMKKENKAVSGETF